MCVSAQAYVCVSVVKLCMSKVECETSEVVCEDLDEVLTSA